jgi:hypothetical protein
MRWQRSWACKSTCGFCKCISLTQGIDDLVWQYNTVCQAIKRKYMKNITPFCHCNWNLYFTFLLTYVTTTVAVMVTCLLNTRKLYRHMLPNSITKGFRVYNKWKKNLIRTESSKYQASNARTVSKKIPACTIKNLLATVCHITGSRFKICCVLYTKHVPHLNLGLLVYSNITLIW